MKKFVVLFVLFLLCSPAFATATAELQNCSSKNYKDFALQHYMRQGFVLQSVNDYSVTFSKIDNSAKGSILAHASGAKIAQFPEIQVILNTVQNGKNLIVQFSVFTLIDKGTAFQKQIALSPKVEVAELNNLNSLFLGSLKNEN